jgi:hypothetical protein
VQLTQLLLQKQQETDRRVTDQRLTVDDHVGAGRTVGGVDRRRQVPQPRVLAAQRVQHLRQPHLKPLRLARQVRVIVVDLPVRLGEPGQQRDLLRVPEQRRRRRVDFGAHTFTRGEQLVQCGGSGGGGHSELLPP